MGPMADVPMGWPNASTTTVILDLSLPGSMGQIAQAPAQPQSSIRRYWSSRRASISDERIRHDLGADYLVKPVAVTELEAKIRALSRRGRGKTETVLRLGKLEMDISGRRAWIGDRALDLTARNGRRWNIWRNAQRIVSKDLVMQSLYRTGTITPNARWKDCFPAAGQSSPSGVSSFAHRPRHGLLP